MFAALYLAADKGTALAEVLGRDKPRGGLNPEELALTKPDSITVVSVSGKVETVVDVRTVSHLRVFVELIKTFELSPALRSEARRLGGYPLQLITSVQLLRQLFAQTNWRNWPSVFDVPAGTQVFGSVVLDAGIEGIVYKSVLTGSECLAVFPKNFVKSSSYVELDDSAPADNIPSRIDSSNFDQFI